MRKKTRINQETYIQKQIFGFSSLNILRSKINVNSYKSISTIEDSSNKTKKLYQKGRDNIHCKTINKECNYPNKLLNKTIHFHKKTIQLKIYQDNQVLF